MNSAANTLTLRARLISSHQLPVNCESEQDFKALLSATIARAPGLFKSAPVVLDISDWSPEKLALPAALTICKDMELVAFALTSQQPEHQAMAEAMGLVWVDYKANKGSIKPSEPANILTETKVITQPVRSGQQIYAANAHLLVTSQVGAGAEVIADGNVHVMGALRGRAIAGAQGWQHAEIVCQQMHAELIAIAGNYLVQDDFPEGQGGARCYLNGAKMNIEFF